MQKLNHTSSRLRAREVRASSSHDCSGRIRSVGQVSASRARPNPSIERTSKTLRVSAASHVKR
jgi:hypothetical protein